MYEHCKMLIDYGVVGSNEIEDIEDGVVDTANEMAQEGWELVSVCQAIGLTETYIAFFRREKK